MGLIKRNGAPGKNTEGAVGDTYMDLETGKNYRCVSAFHDSLGGSEYDWQYTSTTDIPAEKPAPYEVKPQEEKPVSPEQEPAEQNREWSRDNNRKPYNKQYNKHYNQNRN